MVDDRLVRSSISFPRHLNRLGGSTRLLLLLRSYTLFILTGLCLSTFCIDANASSLEDIKLKVERYLKRPGARSANWGIEIVDPENGEILYSLNAEKPFKPASVVKVVTTAAALEKLGPNFRFRTSLYTNGLLLSNGTLDGDLILFGRGDPNLVDLKGSLLKKSAFQELREKLWDLGVRRVKGNIIGDDSYFELASYGKGWTDEDQKSSYGALINALSINNNFIWLHARSAHQDERVRVWTVPRTSYFHIRNLGLTGNPKSRRSLHARLIPNTRTIVVSGNLPASRRGYSRQILLENPAEAAAALFRDELAKNSIAVEGTITSLHEGEVSPETRRRWKHLVDYESPLLIKVLEIINKHSTNLHAEMLLRTLGAELKGAGTDEAGLKTVKEFLQEAGIEQENVSLIDGSGLSRENLLTPHFQTSLLLFLAKRPLFELFRNTLAVSGTDGTLEHRFCSRSLKGLIRAKTGSLDGVATLSGYMTTKSRRNLVFSIFANEITFSKHRVRKTIDEICVLFVRLY